MERTLERLPGFLLLVLNDLKRTDRQRGSRFDLVKVEPRLGLGKTSGEL